MGVKHNKIASLDVDSQNCFTDVCPDELPVEEGTKIVEALNFQASLASFRIGSKDAHPANPIWLADKDHPPFTKFKGVNADLYWPSHCVPGTKGFESIKGLPHPTGYDFFVWKGIEPDMHPYGACFHDFAEKLSTGLIEFLKHHHVGLVIVGGLATDYCVKTTVLQLIKAGFKLIVNLEACKGIDPQTTQEALKAMEAKGAHLAHSRAELKSLLKD